MSSRMLPVLIGGVIFAIIAVTVKQQKKEYGVLVSLAAGILLLLFLFQYLSPLIDFIKKAGEDIGFSDKWLTILVKVLGITLVAQFSGDICRDCGETALASKLETAGKVFILIISLPLFENLLSVITSLL